MRRWDDACPGSMTRNGGELEVALEVSAVGGRRRAAGTAGRDPEGHAGRQRAGWQALKQSRHGGGLVTIWRHNGPDLKRGGTPNMPRRSRGIAAATPPLRPRSGPSAKWEVHYNANTADNRLLHYPHYFRIIFALFWKIEINKKSTLFSHYFRIIFSLFFLS